MNCVPEDLESQPHSISDGVAVSQQVGFYDVELLGLYSLILNSTFLLLLD